MSDSFSTQRGTHALKAGGLATFEQKNENATNQTQGNFAFGTGGGRTAFQNFLTGNADGLCGTNCSYTEAEIDVTNHLRFNRFEFFAQDAWRPRPDVSLDCGVRYALSPPIVDANNLMTNFSPAAYFAANAPKFANATGSLTPVGTGDPLN